MKKIHTPKLRAESKHVARKRQLLVRACAFLISTAHLHAVSPVPPPQTPVGELHAAQLMAAALFARNASPEELQKMEQVFADLDTKYPHDAMIRNGHAEFLWGTGDRNRAVKTWQEAEKLDPNNGAVLDHLGGNAVAIGDVKKAADYYARAVKNAPENADYHFSYANVVFLFRHDLHDSEHPESDSRINEALKHFADAARLAPMNAEYARAFAETFYSVPQPDWREALKAWQHLYDVSAQKDFALLNLARVHMKLGNKPEAKAALAQIQDPKFARLKGRLSERIEAE